MKRLKTITISTVSHLSLFLSLSLSSLRNRFRSNVVQTNIYKIVNGICVLDSSSKTSSRYTCSMLVLSAHQHQYSLRIHVHNIKTIDTFHHNTLNECEMVKRCCCCCSGCSSLSSTLAHALHTYERHYVESGFVSIAVNTR